MSMLGQSLKAQETFGERMSKIAKIFYLTKLCQFDLKKICLVTLLYEGDFESVDLKEKKVLNIASICGGISTGGTETLDLFINAWQKASRCLVHGIRPCPFAEILKID